MNATESYFQHILHTPTAYDAVVTAAADLQEDHDFDAFEDAVVETTQQSDWVGDWDEIDIEDIAFSLLDYLGFDTTPYERITVDISCAPHYEMQLPHADVLRCFVTGTCIGTQTTRFNTSHKEHTVSIEHVTLINGARADHMTDDQIFGVIRALKAEIKSYEDLQGTGSATVRKRVKAAEAQIKELVEIVDDRQVTTEAETAQGE